MVLLKVISLALLLLVRLRFPVDKSITYVFRSRYGNTVVNHMKVWKDWFCISKMKTWAGGFRSFLRKPSNNKFLNLCVINLHLKTSCAYHACQLKLLREEISFKWSRMKTLEKDFNTRKRKLRGTLGITDYKRLLLIFE